MIIDDIEKDKIIDRILINLEKQTIILDENARKTTVIENK